MWLHPYNFYLETNKDVFDMSLFTVGSRSPSPAPSSGVESNSIKDSPLQIDLASDGGNVGT